MGLRDKIVAGQQARNEKFQERKEQIKADTADRRSKLDEKKAAAQEKVAVARERADAAREVAAEKRAEFSRKTAERSGVDASGALFVGQSHESGRNSVVTLFPDRVERVKAKSLGSISRANQDAEVIPVRSVSSVQAKKDGVLFTKVTVYASGNTIEFRFPHDDAARFKAALQQLLLAPAPSATPATAPVDVADQLAKLAALRDQGVLTEDEFAAQKAKVLGL